MHRRICVFCGSRAGARPAYAEAAAELGRHLALRDVGLVYGGGRVGLMGIVADAVLEAGGEVIGVIPEGLFAEEVAHTEVTELREVDSLTTRKRVMAELSDAFIALPGGYGTLDEMFEMITWSQLGIHSKPFGLLDVDGFYAGLVAHVDHAVQEGFVEEKYRPILEVSESVGDLVELLLTRAPPHP